MSSVTEFAHLRIPLAEIRSATNDFAPENEIGRGWSGPVYKGKLFWLEQLIDIVVRRLDRKFGQGDVEFWREISVLSRLKHKNLVSIVGFCDEKEEKTIIYKHETRGSLEKYLRDPTLTWMQRLRICVGVAHALSYLHHEVGRNYSVIHCDIKSSIILLDDSWDAKISGFGLSMRNAVASRRRLCISSACGTKGYVDPAYKTTGTVSHKSDVYSFGVVLFEVLCAERALIWSCMYGFERLARLAKICYEEKTLDKMIDPDLRKQMDPQSFNVFSKIAYSCLKKQRSQRPNMEQIVTELVKALEFQQKHENLLILKEHSMVAGEGILSSNYRKGKNLESFKIPLKDIKLATDNFAEKCLIGSGGYGNVYKAELDHFDREKSSATEGKNEGELSKRRNTVAIKRILGRKDKEGEQGFFAEIETLTSCKHPNIVSLLGFCDEDPEMILVYEYASNGSLDDYLGSIYNMTNLTWVQRIQICIDIAQGLNYLHTIAEDKEKIIHRDIKSANILLDENWVAKIADFGLSKFHSMNQQASTLITSTIAGTDVYLDPEYEKTGRLKTKSDIYSFGVVLFEILCGRLAYDEIYYAGNEKGLPSMARRRFSEGTLKEMVDPKIMEETDQDDYIFTLKRGPNQGSLDTFSEIAYQCLAEIQADRPTMEVVIKKLKKALDLQENHNDIYKISLEDIELATENFSDDNLIGWGGFGKVYKGEVPHANGRNTVVARRLDLIGWQGENEFFTELEVLFEYRHENVIGLVGYCNDMDEKIIVYEHASRGSLHMYLKDASLTWMKRLKICIDVASGLNFLHGGVAITQERVIHRDIKSSNILLCGDWKAKIGDFGMSIISPIDEEMDYVIHTACGTIGYVDPLYVETGLLTKESDIYSFGVVLFEILCGRLTIELNYDDRRRSLSQWVKCSLKEGKLDEIVFEGIKEQIVPKSLFGFQEIAYQCLHDERDKRPTAGEVVVQLKKALEFQEDYEIWEPKLPTDYQEIIQMSKSPEIYSIENKKDLYHMLSKGILLQEGKVWFSLNNNGERNEMISARKFSYENRRSHKWRSISKSRFPTVAKMLDISNLGIKIKIKTQFLSLDVNYGVHLVFKFCCPRKVSSKPMYVNLKYKKGSENLHAYFATQRDDGWMMIELCRFLNGKEDTDFEVLLKSFSKRYCGSGTIHVEGIEFQAINNVKHEEIEELKEDQQLLKSNKNMQLPTECEEILERSKNYDEDEKLFLPSKVNGKKRHMLSAKEALFNPSNVKLFNSKPSTESRLQEMIELLSHQVIRIKCKIARQMLSPDTEYLCYLVFKLSEKCYGLHCPVRVRDQLHRKNKETEFLYFRTPSQLNRHDIHRVPEKREDGWMEVNVWKFNSNYELKNDSFPIDLKLISYEGTMSGLIVCGLEFRPM